MLSSSSSLASMAAERPARFFSLSRELSRTCCRTPTRMSICVHSRRSPSIACLMRANGAAASHTCALYKCKIYCKIPTPQKSFGIPSVHRQDGKAKAGVPHSDCRRKCGCAGKTARSLENTCHTWALLRWCFTKMRYIKCTYLYLLYLWHGPLSDRKGICPEMSEWVSEWVTSLLLALHHR